MREMDSLASTGEQVSAALVAMTIQQMGGKAKSFLGHQIRIQTDDAFTKARIVNIEDSRLRGAVEAGNIAVVAGFSRHRAGRQHHDARAWRLGYDGGRDRGGHQSRRLRDLYRRGRRLHDRPRTSAPRRAKSSASASKRCWSLLRLVRRCCKFDLSR